MNAMTRVTGEMTAPKITTSAIEILASVLDPASATARRPGDRRLRYLRPRRTDLRDRARSRDPPCAPRSSASVPSSGVMPAWIPSEGGAAGHRPRRLLPGLAAVAGRSRGLGRLGQAAVAEWWWRRPLDLCPRSGRGRSTRRCLRRWRADGIPRAELAWSHLGIAAASTRIRHENCLPTALTPLKASAPSTATRGARITFYPVGWADRFAHCVVAAIVRSTAPP